MSFILPLWLSQKITVQNYRHFNLSKSVFYCEVQPLTTCESSKPCMSSLSQYFWVQQLVRKGKWNNLTFLIHAVNFALDRIPSNVVLPSNPFFQGTLQQRWAYTQACLRKTTLQESDCFFWRKKTWKTWASSPRGTSFTWRYLRDGGRLGHGLYWAPAL